MLIITAIDSGAGGEVVSMFSQHVAVRRFV